MSLVHIADRDVPEGLAPGKPRLFATHVLLPPTPRPRERMLLETLRLVAYLYDMPPEALVALLAAGEVVIRAPETVIVRKGPVGENEPLHFHIVTDGQVSVRNGRRVIATLGKANTFREWGISHQRGVHVAYVVAARPSQTVRPDEEAYRRLVDKHPVIQERLSKIRRLLPRLQQVQGQARLKSQTDLGGRSVIESMSVSQLSSLAIFSAVLTFKEGQPIVVRGGEAESWRVSPNAK